MLQTFTLVNFFFAKVGANTAENGTNLSRSWQKLFEFLQIDLKIRPTYVSSPSLSIQEVRPLAHCSSTAGGAEPGTYSAVPVEKFRLGESISQCATRFVYLFTQKSEIRSHLMIKKANEAKVVPLKDFPIFVLFPS